MPVQAIPFPPPPPAPGGGVDLSPQPPIQIAATSGLSLYYVVMLPTGQQWWNLATQHFETSTATNWANYFVTLTEPVVGSGAYFGPLPSNLPTEIALLASIYNQQAGAPASTDPLLLSPDRRTPLTLSFELDEHHSIRSLAPLRSDRNAHPIQIPSRQDSVHAAQQIVDALYQARLKLAAQQHATITIDGQSVTFRDPQKLDDQILFWERKVALLSGRRRRVQQVRLDRW